MTATATKPRIVLKFWEPSDYPILFCWMEPEWHHLATDHMPRSLDAFVALQRIQGAVSFGVYEDGELVGFLSINPLDPDLADAHMVFRKSSRRLVTTIAALEEGKKLAWRMGYRKLIARMFEDHRGAIALIRRVGGIFEGRLLQEARRDGQMVNMVRFALLKEPPLSKQESKKSLT